ncbi:beta-lactamase family protein [Mycobacterium sp. CBMA271]|nr:hypothetical protein [Mycobacteroides sp. CBMA 326]MUM21760.1 beta-lactamase family protein [Mycobacteroides sp. CBMA 271]
MGFAGLLVPAAFAACAREGHHRSFQDWRREFESGVADRMRAAHIVGASVAITSRDSTRYTAAFGFADLGRQRGFTVDTPTHLASVSKLFTASALVQLFERRGLDLHGDVNSFIDFPVRNPHHPDVPITPHQLLTHTSSISDEGYEDIWSEGDPTQSLSDFLRNYLVAGGRAYSPNGSFLSERPGHRWDYCNVAVALAGYVIECVSKQSFSTYVRDNMFRPLDIRNAHWYLKEFAPNVLSKPYEFSDGTFVEMPQEGYADVPAGMLRCSVRDLATSLRAMLGGEPAVLSPAAVDAMLRRQVDPAVAHYQGLGWIEEEIRGRPFVGHSGRDNGTSTVVALTEDRSHAVAVLMNIDRTDATDEFRSSIATDLLYGACLNH